MTSYDRWKTTDRYGEAPDPLEDVPRGTCPYCHGPVREGDKMILESFHASPWPSSCRWDESLTQDQNRIRYAAQKLEESAMYKRIEQQGGEA